MKQACWCWNVALSLGLLASLCGSGAGCDLPTSVCIEGHQLSNGHCCPAGASWVPDRAACICLEASLCGTGAPVTPPLGPPPVQPAEAPAEAPFDPLSGALSVFARVQACAGDLACEESVFRDLREASPPTPGAEEAAEAEPAAEPAEDRHVTEELHGSPDPGEADESPSRSAITQAMEEITPAVQACGAGEHGQVTGTLIITGPTGRVTLATVSGPFSGTPVGACVARALRGATFPPITRPTYTITYPFRL